MLAHKRERATVRPRCQTVAGTCKSYKDKKVGEKDKVERRNKTSDRDGRVYDQRKGEWTSRDKAEVEFGYRVMQGPCLERVEAELAIMNYPGKLGPPFQVAPCVVLYFDRMRQMFSMSYRFIEGVVRAILEPKGIYCPTFSEAQKVLKSYNSDPELAEIIRSAGEYIDGMFEPVFTETETTIEESLDEGCEIEDSDIMTVFVLPPPDGRDIECALDGSGQTISHTGPYLRVKHGLDHARFIHQHALVDITSKSLKPIAYMITTDEIGDSKAMDLLLREAVKAGHRIRKLYADGAYEGYSHWDVADELGIEFVVNIPKNRKTSLRNFTRNDAIRRYRSMTRDEWVRLTGYGRRWYVEVFFSVLKRVFGDNINATTFVMQKAGMRTKYELHAERARIQEKRLGNLRI